ncbi:hypothetical protein VIGAN_02090400 [Vigna angularis var. angularis]|uniref:Uncharacterized protein n=1 Tax=Vigna angularis var. angularis TaxID=157739 RepID=A0A0S3RCG1_PHAAN|nr:hypothetical protein VIGAN_02090400 [Vigna angularis var. angularis]
MHLVGLFMSANFTVRRGFTLLLLYNQSQEMEAVTFTQIVSAGHDFSMYIMCNFKYATIDLCTASLVVVT